MAARKEKILIIFISSLLIISNSFWLFNNYRTNNRATYNATYNCEQKELIYCLRTFQIGISFEEFKTIISQSNIEFSNKFENKNNFHLEVKNIFSLCPISGRPYCGISFEFENKKLVTINSGYPCH